MNIKIICDKDPKLKRFSNQLRKHFSNNYNEYNIKFIKAKVKNQDSIDSYIIISDDLEYIYKNSFNIEIREKLVILTSNLRAANIIGCLNITSCVYYINSKLESIAFKIIKLYKRNNNLYFSSNKKR